MLDDNVSGYRGKQVPGLLRQDRGKRGKKGLRKEQLEALKRVLYQARAMVLGELASTGHPSSEGIGDEKGDTYDLSVRDLTRTLTYMFRERDQNKLRAIEEALDRIKEGTFGICENCGNEIPVARLEAMPFAVTCVPCKTEQEKYEKMFSSFQGDLLSDEVDPSEFVRRDED